MMMTIFYIVLGLYLTLFLVRLLLSMLYYKKQSGKAKAEFHEENYTVIQPIVSGDPRLPEDLSANLKATSKLRFFWLMDKKDQAAEVICRKICENPDYADRVTLFFFEEAPQSVNPKVHKVRQVISQVQTPYLIVLDDDSVIDFSKMGELSHYEKSKQEVIVTGIPHNYGQGGFWTNLVAAFVNGNSYITYFSMAQLGKNESINGMFYIVSKEIAENYQLFGETAYYLCDDLAVAEHLTKHGVKIVQSHIHVNVRTTMANAQQYFRQMKRWLLFSSIYMKGHFSLAMAVLILLSNSLPLLLLILGAAAGLPTLFTAVGVLFFKAIVMYGYRRFLLAKGQSVMAIFYEVLGDLVLMPLFLMTLVTKPRILWRNKWIYVTDGRITYEHI